MPLAVLVVRDNEFQVVGLLVFIWFGKGSISAAFDRRCCTF